MRSLAPSTPRLSSRAPSATRQRAPVAPTAMLNKGSHSGDVRPHSAVAPAPAASATEAAPAEAAEAPKPTVFSETTFSLLRPVRTVSTVRVQVSKEMSTGRVRVLIGSDLPGTQLLHWGVVPVDVVEEGKEPVVAADDTWVAPDAAARPEGTKEYDETAVQTPRAGGKVELYFEAGAVPKALNFVFYEPAAEIWSHTEDDNVWHVKLPPPGDLPAVPESTAPPPEVDGWTDTFGFSDNVPLATLIPVALSCRVESSGAPGGGVHVRIAAPAPADANVGGAEAGLPPLLLHWGFVPRGGRNDVWALPQQPSWPEGTKSVNGRALQSKLLPLADAPGFVGVDIELGSNASLIGFVLKEDIANGAWIDNAGGNYVVSLPAVAHQQAAARAKPVFTPPSEEAEDEEAFAGWEAKGTAAPRSASARATDRAKAEKADWLANWLHAPDEMTSAEAVAAHDAAVAAAAAAAPAPAEAPQQAAAAPSAMERRAKERKLAPSVKNVFARNQVEKAVPTDPAVSPPLKVNPKQTLAGTGSGREVLLQGFNWESARSKAEGGWYGVVAANAKTIADMGVTAVWLPPPTDSVSAEGYMPRDLYNLNSKYGGVDALRNTVKALHDVGVKAIGDAVLNHRCGQFQDANGVWNRFGGKLNWDARAIVQDDPHFAGEGGPSTGDFFGAAPNIDHNQPFVRKDIAEWMLWLRNHVGYDGWRLDFVRGFSGEAVKEYCEKTTPSFVVGEFWDSLAYDGSDPSHNQDAHRQRIINWINQAGALGGAFDVTTKGILHAVFERQEFWRLSDSAGKPPGVMGWWPSRAVTFIENHDTGSTQGHWKFPEGCELAGYAYILSHPGTPTIFWDHVFDWPHLKEPILKLVALRARAGVHCRSDVNILASEQAVYAACIDDVLCLKLGPGDWSPDDKEKWKVAESGDNWCTWELAKK